MISREELELLISGAVAQAGLAIESANGRVLTRSEVERLTGVVSTAMRLVVERCQPKTAPPPPPAARAPRVFKPALTQEIRVVTDDDIRKTLAGMSAEDLKKVRG